MKMTSYPNGTFSWIELATTDPAAAKRFYTELLSLQSVDTPAGPDMMYTLLKKGDSDVGGVYKLMPEMEAPPNWMPYITVANVDSSRQKALDLGADSGPEPMDVGEMGRMAILRDPAGAHFALWQPKTHYGMGAVGEHGTFCWAELQTGETQKAVPFYTSLFGWTAKESPEYIEFHRPGEGKGEAVGGLRPVSQGPGHWLIYFAVDDVDACVAKAERLGAKTLAPLFDIPNVGRMAVLQDPQGAVFAIIKLTM